MFRRFATAVSLIVTSGVFAADVPLRQQIDAEIKAAWETEKVKPAGRSGDAEFLRRIYIDLVGAIPTYDETAAFLKDADPAKREKLIDTLLADPRFNAHQADVWDLTFFGRNPAGGDPLRKRDPFKKWLTEKFAKGVPYDQWVRDMILAEQDGSEMFYAQFRGNPEEATVQISRLFLGTQLQCARCHDHPFDKWTQKDFYGMTGFFVRLVVDGGVGAKSKFVISEKAVGEVMFTGAVKDQKPGQKGEPIKPRFLGGDELQEPPAPKEAATTPAPKDGTKLPKPAFSRRDKIVTWLTAKENPYFAKAAANRVWAQFMGRGIIHPVDDINEQNSPALPKLFETLEKELFAHNFDLKWLIREVVNSEAYQLSSKGPSKQALPKHYEQARVRPLSAEEILAAVRQATLYDADGAKAALPNSGDVYFLRYFGEPTDGLGEFQGSISEHLFLNNGPLWQIIRRKKGNLAETLANSTDSPEQKVEQMYLTILNRPPSDAEKAKFAKFIQEPAGKTDNSPIDEAIWVLLNSAEFRFNH